MTKKEKIIERLKLLNRMKEGGEAGERANAAAIMEEIMRKHGINEADLESDGEAMFWVQVESPLHKKLFLQILGLVSGERRMRVRFLPELPEDAEKQMRMDLRHVIPEEDRYNMVGWAKTSDFAETIAKYNMYKDDFNKNLNQFYYAYLYKNDLLAEPEEGESENMDREKMDSVLNSIRMAYGIKRANVLRQLEGGGQ